jgi:DNA-directed RNA polymerase subunit N (RpoN/RPB10)
MQYFYEFYLASCTCRGNIGHYHGLVISYLQEGKTWDEIFDLLHIVKLCCKSKLAMPYTMNFDYQIDSVVEGLIDSNKIPYYGYDFWRYVNGPITNNLIEEEKDIEGPSVSVYNKTNDPVYVGRPVMLKEHNIKEEEVIGNHNGVKLLVQRIVTKYICA